MAADTKCEPSIQFDLFELSPKSCLLRRNGLFVDLPPQALKVLAMLAARPNELVTRKEVKEALWPGEAFGDFDSRLNFTVKKLREALGDSAEQPRYVQTVRSAGYMFIAPVRTTQDVTTDSHHNLAGAGVGIIQMPAEHSAAASSLPSHASHGFRFGLSALVVAVIAVVVSAVAFGAFGLRPRSTNPGIEFGPEVRNGLTSVDGVPEISSVSRIVPQATQKIVIRGRGFGLHVAYSHTDSPFLAIRDETGDWSAGRMVPYNWDEIMLDVESWTNEEIVITGFSGKYGLNGWRLADGDELEIRVWNPQSGTGPARFKAVVISAGAAR